MSEGFHVRAVCFWRNGEFVEYPIDCPELDALMQRCLDEKTVVLLPVPRPEAREEG